MRRVGASTTSTEPRAYRNEPKRTKCPIDEKFYNCICNTKQNIKKTVKKATFECAQQYVTLGKVLRNLNIQFSVPGSYIFLDQRIHTDKLT